MSARDPYRGVLLVILLLAVLGTAAALSGGVILQSLALFDAAVSLTLATGVLIGVISVRNTRLSGIAEDQSVPTELATPTDPAASEIPAETVPTAAETSASIQRRIAKAAETIKVWRHDLGAVGYVRIGTGAVGLLLVTFVMFDGPAAATPRPVAAATAALLALVAAGLAATVAHYLSEVDAALLPEAPWLCRGARVLAWVLILAAISVGLAWAGQQTILHAVHYVLLGINATVAYGLIKSTPAAARRIETFPLELGALSALGNRPNILASALDRLEAQLGIDLRSTWALMLVRRSVEPLVLSLVLIGWLSTSLTVVGVQEQALVERFGVPVGRALMPGLHLHWPWPVDRVTRLPVQRVETVHVGHEGEENSGPEDVLWARQHAVNEYTLLLGDGRDLITIDAAVQFRIADLRAWRYHSQNPTDALRAIAYRAVMRSTVNLTLSQALSQNVVTLTQRMRKMVQHDADALGLGVDVIAFTVGGMHPPVQVAAAYQAVGSSELGKVTAVINANVFRNRNVPTAEASVLTSQNAARGEAVELTARATAEAWSFTALAAQYRADREDYTFRRRLEALEKGLASRRFTVVDARFQRDGGELWMRP